MQKLVFRVAFLAVPLAVAGWMAGCSSDESGVVSDPPDAAVPETAPQDQYVPPPDAADAAKPKRDCAADLDADGIHEHLDCAGLYSDFDSKTVAPENKPYTPGVQFWSDGAEKSRFLYLPPGTKIDITDFDEWKFPNGTRVFKEFKLGGKRIETRMFLKVKDVWQHTTYRWNDAETDAVRKDSGEKVAVAGKPAYEIPSSTNCDYCHMGRKDQLLGIEAVSLGIATAQGVTLASLTAEGRLSAMPPATTMAIPDDGTTKAAPALGWLHANCGSCHNANPSAAANFLATPLRFLLKGTELTNDAVPSTVTNLDAYKTAVGVVSSRQDVDAGTSYVRIVKNDPSASLVSILSGRRVVPPDEPNAVVQMPPVVTRVVDAQGHALLDAWITAMP
ncbi:MAG: hypothetical protein JWP87_894 [Labilithrix sp.]|nr:hypothetical protein [Labilithrix sp.]